MNMSVFRNNQISFSVCHYSSDNGAKETVSDQIQKQAEVRIPNTQVIGDLGNDIPPRSLGAPGSSPYLSPQ